MSLYVILYYPLLCLNYCTFLSNKCPFWKNYKGDSLETFQVAQQTCVALLCSEQGTVKVQCPLCSLLAHSSLFIKKRSSFCTYLFKDLWYILRKQKLTCV